MLRKSMAGRLPTQGIAAGQETAGGAKSSPGGTWWLAPGQGQMGGKVVRY